MYIVYIHTIKTTEKSYIGYTCKGLSTRLNQHIQLAQNGSQTKFHRAIRKYGVDKIESRVLHSCQTKEEAEKVEIDFIKRLDTFYHGYNMTLGGDGGDTFISQPFDKQAMLREIKSLQSAGKNNPRFCGYEDFIIINEAVKYFQKHRKFIRRRWFEYSKKKNLPASYSKCRFNGFGYKGFIDKLKSELTNRQIPWSEDDFILSKKERYNEAVNRKIGLSISGRKWYNDGTNNYQVYPQEAEGRELIPGRINVKNQKADS